MGFCVKCYLLVSESATETKFSYPFLFAQFIVSNLLKIMVTFIFKNAHRKVLVLAVKVGFLEPNHARDLEPSLAIL